MCLEAGWTTSSWETRKKIKNAYYPVLVGPKHKSLLVNWTMYLDKYWQQTLNKSDLIQA